MVTLYTPQYRRLVIKFDTSLGRVCGIRQGGAMRVEIMIRKWASRAEGRKNTHRIVLIRKADVPKKPTTCQKRDVGGVAFDLME